MTPIFTHTEPGEEPADVDKAGVKGVIAVTPDGKNVYVANDTANTVTPVSTRHRYPGRPIPGI